MKKGYRPVLERSEKARDLRDDIRALEELKGELLETIQTLAPRRVTRAELLRDWGFTRAALSFLERAGWLTSDSRRGYRKTYDFQEVMRLVLLLPALKTVCSIRLRRKYGNIVSVQRDVVTRILAGRFDRVNRQS